MTLESEDVFSVHIPQEMYDLIIEQLSDNSSTLAACSLTCRAWEPSARLHLFRTLRVPEDTDSIANWTQRLQNAPHVARWVRELEVPTFVGIGQLVPSVFPGVRHITVGPAVVAKDRGRGDMSKCYKEDALSLRAISHIKTLSLKRMEVTDIELVLLMSHASTLSSLALDNVTMFTIDPVRVRDLAPQMHGFLTTLNVQNASKNLVKRLLKIISPYQLRILQFPVGNIADAEQLYGILESLLSSLKEVTITIANRAQTDGKLGKCGLSTPVATYSSDKYSRSRVPARTRGSLQPSSSRSPHPNNLQLEGMFLDTRARPCCASPQQDTRFSRQQN